MVDALNNNERRALIFAPANDQAGQSLQIALQQVGFSVALVIQLSHGLGAFRGDRAGEPLYSIVIILGGQSGLSGPIIAQALRGVPELAELPIILVSDTPVPLARCVVISRLMDNADICALALQEPKHWQSVGVIRPDSPRYSINNTTSTVNGIVTEVDTPRKSSPTQSQETKEDNLGKATEISDIAPVSLSPNRSGVLPIIPMSLPHTVVTTPDEEFDPNPLLKICARSPGSAKEIAALIRGDLVRALNDFPRLQSNGDLAALSKAAHKIHGASGSLGAMDVYNTCLTLEKAAASGNHSECQVAVNAAVFSMLRFVQRLDRFFITPN